MKRHVCADCRTEQEKWIYMEPELVRRIKRPGIRIHTVAGNARCIADANKARSDDFYALVRRQCTMIADACERNHQTDMAEGNRR